MKKGRTDKSQFSYNGNLSEQALPELLFTIGQYRVPGVLSIVNEGITKQIFVSNGNIIFAASNAPGDHLGEFLFRCGKITRIDFDKSSELMSQQKGKWQGEILIEMGALQKEELPWAVRSHQQAIVWSLFNWFEGDVAFHLRKFRHSKPIQLDIPIPRAILDGVRHIQNAKRVITLMGNRSTILRAEENALLCIEMYGAEEKERTVLRSVDGKTNLYDLCALSPYAPHETARILYGLFTLKLVSRKEIEGIHVVSGLPAPSFH
jgi:Domain of unknown function (DUF4388)